MFKIVQTDRPFSDRLEEERVFNNSGLEISFTTYDCMDEAELKKICADADGLIVAYAPISASVIDSMPKCRGISFMATGFNSVDLDYATGKGIVVTNVSDYCAIEVSDHTLGFILNLSRNILSLHRSVQAGAWDYEACGVPGRISDQSLGLIGLGKIGRMVAKKAQAFGLTVLAYDPYVDADTMRQLQVEKVGLNEALFADFVSLHCCLNHDTVNIINQQTLQRMKPSAYLINTARGACVDIEALSDHLAGNRIQGAALDVVYPEPLPADHRIFSFGNVMITPHAAFFSAVSSIEVRRKSCQDAVSILKGITPRYIVNPEVLERPNCRLG